MSDPKLQRADGFSVFFSLILGILFVSAYFLIQMFFDIEESTDINPVTTEIRRQKVENYEKNSVQFERSINEFHSNSNSNLESSMQKTMQEYNPDSQNIKNLK